MRLRIAHQLSLLLMGAVLFAIASVGGVVVWNLQNGFSDYVRARDDEQLGRLVRLIERRAAADPSMNWLRGSREAMRQLMQEFAQNESLDPLPSSLAPPAPRPRPPPADRDGSSPQRPPPPEAGDRPPPRPPPDRAAPPPPERGVHSLSGRVQIEDAEGRWLAGRLDGAGGAGGAGGADLPSIQRAVKVGGSAVAIVRLTQAPRLEGLDARFLSRQYWGLGAAALLTLGLSLLAAVLVARRWSRPLRAVQAATRAIAQGDFALQLPLAGGYEMAQLIGDINAMSAALHQLEGARRVWIAQISHELRTPLSVLRGELEAVEDGARQATPQLMASLHDEVLQLTRLVGDLHTLAMADIGQMPCHFVWGDAQAGLQHCCQRFAARASQAGLQLQIASAAGTAPVQVRWDFGRIEQLLGNLIENSLRYTVAPGVIQVTWSIAQTHTLLPGPAICVEVEDSAPGVAPSDMPLLFEPLYRADRARQRDTRLPGQQHGSGLGLSIALGIARAHGGSIQATASALGGLRMRVCLPLDAARSPPQAGAAA